MKAVHKNMKEMLNRNKTFHTAGIASTSGKMLWFDACLLDG